MKRTLDLVLGVIAGTVLLVPLVVVALAVKMTSKGPALYWSDRVGRNNVIFKMPKFRSMRVGTPAVATHLLADPKSHLVLFCARAVWMSCHSCGAFWWAI
jgi:O-antigen biosynthesis protein WbqP